MIKYYLWFRIFKSLTPTDFNLQKKKHTDTSQTLMKSKQIQLSS